MSTGSEPDPVLRVRPAPLVSRDNEFYWKAASEGRLVVQRCDGCGAVRHPPLPVCPRCHSTLWHEHRLSGRGNVASWILVHHPPNPWFDMPILVATVDLDVDDLGAAVDPGGIHLVTNLCAVEPDGVTIGMPVEVVFAPTDDGWGVPLFRPRATSAS